MESIKQEIMSFDESVEKFELVDDRDNEPQIKSGKDIPFGNALFIERTTGERWRMDFFSDFSWQLAVNYKCLIQCYMGDNVNEISLAGLE